MSDFAERMRAAKAKKKAGAAGSPGEPDEVQGAQEAAGSQEVGDTSATVEEAGKTGKPWILGGDLKTGDYF